MPSGQSQKNDIPFDETPCVVILGVTQDAGYPQAGCYKPHCMMAWNDPVLKRSAVSLGLVDPKTRKKWLFEATPDIKEQLFELQKFAPDSTYEFAGVFLTHGHMGHYTGLIHLGIESMTTRNVNVYAMPRMHDYLTSNGPWSQLVNLNNIRLQSIKDSTVVKLTDDISVMPFKVPHREEYTEAIGFHIMGPGKSLLFIPDIDKWEKWDVNLAEIHDKWNCAFVDATFFRDGELQGRDMSKILHPFVTESFSYFDSVPDEKKANIHFIHFNHTNPLLIDGSNEQKEVKDQGFNYAYEGQVVALD